MLIFAYFLFISLKPERRKNKNQKSFPWSNSYLERNLLRKVKKAKEKVKSLSRVWLFETQWTLCSLPGFSVHGNFQTRVLEWVAVSFSRGSSSLRGWTWVSCTADRCFTTWASREAPIKIAVNSNNLEIKLWENNISISQRAAIIIH